MCNEEKEETEPILTIPNSIQNLYLKELYIWLKKGSNPR